MSKCKFKIESIEAAKGARINDQGVQVPCLNHKIEFRSLKEGEPVKMCLSTSDPEEAKKFELGKEYVLVTEEEIAEFFDKGKAAGIEESKAAGTEEGKEPAAGEGSIQS